MTPIRSEAELPPVFRPVLQRLRDDAARSPLGARLVPVAHQARPFSNVVRLQVTPEGDASPAYWYAKVQTLKDIPDADAHMRRRVLHEFETTGKVERALTGRAGLDALHPIACYPELHTIVTEEIRGITLLRYLEERLSWIGGAAGIAQAAEAAGRAGAWLRFFQQIDPCDDEIQTEALRDYIDLRLQRLVSSGRSPITPPVRLRVLRHVEALGAVVPSAQRRSVMLHADLAPGNIMVTSRGVAVLDFAMASRGTYLHDLARLTLQIDLMRGKPHFRPAAIGDVVSALLQGFDPDVSPGQPLFRLLSLLHRVNHLATLTLSRARGPARLYNYRLRRMHERAIERELTMTIDGGRRPCVAAGPGT